MLRYRREIFILEVLGIFEDDTIISEDSRRIPKSSKDLRSLPRTSEVSGRELAPSAFHLQKSEIARRVLSFIPFAHGFRSNMGLS